MMKPRRDQSLMGVSFTGPHRLDTEPGSRQFGITTLTVPEIVVLLDPAPCRRWPLQCQAPGASVYGVDGTSDFGSLARCRASNSKAREEKQ